MSNVRIITVASSCTEAGVFKAALETERRVVTNARNVAHLGENLRALDVTLTPADLRTIDVDSAAITVHGGRMSEPHMRQVDQAG